MRHLFAGLLLCVLAWAFAGCVKKDVATTGAIHGTVRDSESNQPLPGCSVMLMPTGMTATTGTDGSFHFEELLPDTYSVEVSCYNYYTNKKSIIVGVADASMSVDILLTRFDPNNRLAELGALKVGEVSFKSARVECEVIDQGSSSITERGFLYSETPDVTLATARKQIVKTTEDIFSATLNNLAEKTDYYVAAYAINGRGTAYSEVVKFTTGDASTVTAPTNVIYVSVAGNDANDGSSWSKAKKTIKAALEQATDKKQIWVSVGNYDEKITLKSGVPIYGGFKGTETTTETRTERTKIIAIWGECSSETIVDGFEIGSKEETITLKGNVILENCHIKKCGADAYVTMSTQGENKLNNCIIEECRASWGRSIYFSISGNLSMTNCLLQGNKHFYIQVYGAMSMYNCVIANNATPLNRYLSNPFIVAKNSNTAINLYNCTLVSNEEIFECYNEGVKNINLYNCLYWNNAPISEDVTQYSCIVVDNADNSRVKLKRPSTTRGPEASDWQIADWSIQAGSSCIDAGISLLFPSDKIKIDLAGNERIAGNSIDVGAYEY